MSREIEFRAFYEKTEEQDSEMIHFPFNQLDFLVCDSDNPKVHIMQYTGLKDKNGAKIFEGDILQMDESSFCKVIWSDDSTPGFYLDGNDEWCDDWDGDESYRMEIICNIHQATEEQLKEWGIEK